jgi:hypothetical protein
MENILQNIDAQVEANNTGLKWAQAHLKGTSLRDVRRNLLENKVSLSYINDASQVKPGVALFGASQVGKSYLSNYLLATDLHPLHVYDNIGNSVGFLNTIDPAGNGKEATALVTRFSLDNTCGPNPRYPYRVKLLKPIEIIMTLVDGYFNDVKGQIVSTKEEIEEEKRRIIAKYSSASNTKPIITAEDICELRNYFNPRYLSQRLDFCENLERCDYFATLDSIVEKLSPHDLIDVFGFLWKYNPIIVEVFSSVVDIYEKIGFSTEVYVSLDALKREEGTILHVDRIYEFVGLDKLTQEMRSTVEPAKIKEMSMLLEDGTIAFNIPKSHFCMIAREVAFSVANVNDEKQVADMLKEKPFLKAMDILDFPGARSRKEILASGFNYDGVVHMLVRGKVAYLFNKYSHQYLISSLIFCQDNSQANVTSLPRLIDGWVRDNVGKDITQRTQLMRVTNGISPLLMVATKFNEYLKQANNLTISDSERRKEEMMSIWVRMASALSAAAVIAGSSDSWFDNWTVDSPFKVIFPLRGYKYSAELYDGYREVDDQITDREHKMSAHFSEIYNDLRKTFMDTRSEFIQLHLNDAECLWNEVTGVNTDGSKPILKYLESVANEIGSMRDDTFARLLSLTFNQVVDTLLKYYHDDNAAVELGRQRKIASRLRMSLDYQFGHDKDFFSDFISSMMVDESSLHDIILDTINATKVVEATDVTELFAIRERAQLLPEYTPEECKQRLMDVYCCDSEDELQELLDESGLSIDQIIAPTASTNLARLIADAIEQEWKDFHLNPEDYNSFAQRGIKMGLIENFIDNIRALYSTRLHMSEKVAERINQFVAGATAIDELADMIADICSQMINRFASSMGAAYFSNEDWGEIEATCKRLNIPIALHKDVFGVVNFDSASVRATLPAVFEAFDSNIQSTNHQNETKKYMSNWVEYQQWIDLMEVSFLATAGIPTYDVAMNDALKVIIEVNLVNAKALKRFAISHKGLNELVTIKRVEL